MRHCAGARGRGGSLDSVGDTVALARPASGAGERGGDHGTLQTVRARAPGLLRSVGVRADGAVSGRALRAVVDGERVALSGVRASVGLVSTVPRRRDPGCGRRHRGRALGAALATMAPPVTRRPRPRRRVGAHRAGGTSARTAPTVRTRSLRATTTRRWRSARDAGGVVCRALADRIALARQTASRRRSARGRPSGSTKTRCAACAHHRECRGTGFGRWGRS